MSKNYETYLELVSKEAIPEELDLPGTFLVIWGNGDRSVVSAETRMHLFLLLDEVGDPYGPTFKRLDEGCAVHFERVGAPLEEDCESNGIFQFESMNEQVEEEIVGLHCSH